jgi:hypothetical protein
MVKYDGFDAKIGGFGPYLVSQKSSQILIFTKDQKFVDARGFLVRLAPKQKPGKL